MCITSIILLSIIGIIFLICKYTAFWCTSKKCLIGKTAIITGGASGLGFETALALASKGCRVIIADVAKGPEAAEKIKQQTQNPHVISKFIDLRSYKSVRAFASDILTTESRLDILLCNAGVGHHRFKLTTEDGMDVSMQVNHLSHFLLTHLLLGLLKKTAPSRVVFTSSLAGYFSMFTLNEMNPTAEYYERWNTKLLAAPYCNAKLAMAAVTRIFAEKLKDSGVTVNAVHPGIVKTPFIAQSVIDDKNHILGLWFVLMSNIVGKNPEAGAQPLIHLAHCDDVKDMTGQSFVEGRRFFRPPQLTQHFCNQLWDVSVKMVGLKPAEVGC